MLHFTEVKCRIRLACVRHAASVRSEPGSNSPLVPVTRCGRVGLPTPPSNTLALAHLCLSLCVKEPVPPSRPFPVAVSEGRSISPLFLSSLFYLFYFFSSARRKRFFFASLAATHAARDNCLRVPRRVCSLLPTPASFVKFFLTTFFFFSGAVWNSFCIACPRRRDSSSSPLPVLSSAFF